MRDLKGFMNFVGVTKKKYVDDWIDKDLIPGAFRDKEKIHIPSLILHDDPTETAD